MIKVNVQKRYLDLIEMENSFWNLLKPMVPSFQLILSRVLDQAFLNLIECIKTRWVWLKWMYKITFIWTRRIMSFGICFGVHSWHGRREQLWNITGLDIQFPSSKYIPKWPIWKWTITENKKFKTWIVYQVLSDCEVC